MPGENAGGMGHGYKHSKVWADVPRGVVTGRPPVYGGGGGNGGEGGAVWHVGQVRHYAKGGA